jgi:hypothetical protein
MLVLNCQPMNADVPEPPQGAPLELAVRSAQIPAGVLAG